MDKTKRLDIKPFKYRSRCDTIGCSGTAKHSLIYTGRPASAAHNICPKCLQDIVDQVPLEMLLKRPDIQEHIKMLVEEAAYVDPEATEMPLTEEESLPFDDTQEEIGDPDWLDGLKDDEEGIPDEEAIVKAYSWQDLRALAKDLGINPVGKKREALEKEVLEALKQVEE